jgi:hypothetical protein
MGEPLRKLAIIGQGYADRSRSLSFVTDAAHGADVKTL